MGDVIKDKNRLTLQTPDSFKASFNVDVRVFNEVVGIDKSSKTVTVKNLKDNTTYSESYDKLVLSPGQRRLSRRLRGLITIRCLPCEISLIPIGLRIFAIVKNLNLRWSLAVDISGLRWWKTFMHWGSI